MHQGQSLTKFSVSTITLGELGNRYAEKFFFFQSVIIGTVKEIRGQGKFAKKQTCKQNNLSTKERDKRYMK